MKARKRQTANADKIKDKEMSGRSRLYTSVLLVLMALVAVTAATVAWFSIADNTKVKTMSLDIVADTDLRMDLDPHETIGQYVKTLSFESIADRIQSEKGFSMRDKPLDPVTTSDEQTFTYENGTVVSDTSGAYLEFTLQKMAIWKKSKNIFPVQTASPGQRMVHLLPHRIRHCRRPCGSHLPQTDRPGSTIREWEMAAVSQERRRYSGCRVQIRCR